MLSHYVKVTFRESVKYKAQSIISILGLAIGFTVFVLGNYWLWWETHFDNFHPEADRLYCLTTEGLVKRANGTQSDLDQLHINDREELFKLLPEIEASCSFNHLSFTLKQDNEAINLHGMESGQSFFNLFQADFIEGTHKGIVPDGSSVILTKRTAHKLFGTTNCIGKEVVLDNNLRPSVAGVIRVYPDNTVLAEKDEKIETLTAELEIKDKAVISAGEKIGKLNVQISELQPYKEQVEKAEQEKIEAEIAEEKESLKKNLLKGGLFTEKEIAKAEIAELIEARDKTAINSLIAEKYIASFDKEETDVAEDVETEEPNPMPATASLETDDVNESASSFMTRFLSRR